MTTVGLITEYNPFHNGHLYHLRESRKAAEADVAVAVMSGHFLQRGEPALADKWVRAEMALRGRGRCGGGAALSLGLQQRASFRPGGGAGAERLRRRRGPLLRQRGGRSCRSCSAAPTCCPARKRRWRSAPQELLKAGMTYPEARARVFAELAGGDLDPGAPAAPRTTSWESSI